MAVEGEGASSDKIYRPLGLVGIHYGQVENDGFAFSESLNRLGHFFKGTGFHDHDFGNAVCSAG